MSLFGRSPIPSKLVTSFMDGPQGNAWLGLQAIFPEKKPRFFLFSVFSALLCVLYRGGITVLSKPYFLGLAKSWRGGPFVKCLIMTFHFALKYFQVFMLHHIWTFIYIPGLVFMGIQLYHNSLLMYYYLYTMTGHLKLTVWFIFFAKYL